FVVIPTRPAGGERVTEPEAEVARDFIGDVGERRRTFVGRNHEIGIIAVVTSRVRGRHDLADTVRTGDQIVREFQQATDERAIAGLAFGRPAFAVTLRIGQPLGDEATLGPHRHDHGVLDHLRLDQSQYFGTEILAPVGPAQSAAGDRAVSQMYALQPWRVDPDLVLGAGFGQVRNPAGVELDGEHAAL